MSNKRGTKTGVVDFCEFTELRLARHMTAGEVFLKLWGHDIVKMSVQVDTLFVHLPRESEIIYEDGMEEQAAKIELNRRLRGVERRTKLTEFFRVCKEDGFDITYDHVHEKYKWDDRQKTWKKWNMKPRKKLVRVGAASAGNLELQATFNHSYDLI